MEVGKKTLDSGVLPRILLYVFQLIEKERMKTKRKKEKEFDIGTFIIQLFLTFFLFFFPCSLTHGQMPYAIKATGFSNWTLSKTQCVKMKNK